MDLEVGLDLGLDRGGDVGINGCVFVRVRVRSRLRSDIRVDIGIHRRLVDVANTLIRRTRRRTSRHIRNRRHRRLRRHIRRRAIRRRRRRCRRRRSRRRRRIPIVPKPVTEVHLASQRRSEMRILRQVGHTEPGAQVDVTSSLREGSVPPGLRRRRRAYDGFWAQSSRECRAR